MGGPSGGAGPLSNYAKKLEYNVRDLSLGASEIGNGNITNGVGNIGQGTMGLMSYGAGNWMLPPGGSEQTDMANNAAAAAQGDIQTGLNMKELDRRSRIQTGLKEAIKLRTKQPGKQQTLLTSALEPSATSPGTLLTTTGKR